MLHLRTILWKWHEANRGERSIAINAGQLLCSLPGWLFHQGEMQRNAAMTCDIATDKLDCKKGTIAIPHVSSFRTHNKVCGYVIGDQDWREAPPLARHQGHGSLLVQITEYRGTRPPRILDCHEILRRILDLVGGSRTFLLSSPRVMTTEEHRTHPQ